MFRYKHAYHAGHYHDIHKHAVLCAVLESLRQKEAPFAVLDTHAGAGFYHLGGKEAAATLGHKEGVGRFLAAGEPPPPLRPYWAALRASESFTWAGEKASKKDSGRYPGSPWFIRQRLRPDDALIACELNPREGETLKSVFEGDKRVHVHIQDGWQALKAFLPPKERRGLVLIDPPFDEPGEFDRLYNGLVLAKKRFSAGVFMLWYPKLDATSTDLWHRLLVRSGIKKILISEICPAGGLEAGRAQGSGLAIINPPWKLDESLREAQPWLLETLSPGGRGSQHLQWLVGED